MISTVFLTADNVEFTPQTPTFYPDKGQNVVVINVKNISNSKMVCTPQISEDDTYDNKDFPLVNSIMIFPKQFVLEKGMSSEVRLYLTNVAGLPEGESSARLTILTANQTDVSGSSFVDVQESGAIKVFKGDLVQIVAMGNLQLTSVRGDAMASESGSSLVFHSGNGYKISGQVINKGNIQAIYGIVSKFYDINDKEVGVRSIYGEIPRATQGDFSLEYEGVSVTHASVELSIQKDCVNEEGEFQTVSSQNINLE